MDYDVLLVEAEKNSLVTKEKPLKAYNGRIKGNKIIIRKDLPTKEKACVLAEELGHHYTSVGDILDQTKTENRKQEQRARAWAYDKMIGLAGIVNAYENRCGSLHETAEFLNVTEEFLQEALMYYKNKHGLYTTVGNYVIVFEPNLGVCKLIR